SRPPATPSCSSASRPSAAGRPRRHRGGSPACRELSPKPVRLCNGGRKGYTGAAEHGQPMSQPPPEPSQARRAPPAPGRPAAPPAKRPASQAPAPARTPDKKPASPMTPRPWWLAFLVLLAINYAIASFLLPGTAAQRTEIPYTTFKQQIEAG